MRHRYAMALGCIAAAGLLLGIQALTQSPAPVKMQGVFHDFVASSTTPAGPWEVGGEWSLKLKGRSGTADFQAALTMVRSDWWVQNTFADINDPAARVPHTHHVSLVDGQVWPLANGFRVTGTAFLTGNGNSSGSAPVEIDITGGDAIRFSNIKLTFSGGATGHYGTQPLEGVVVQFAAFRRNTSQDDDEDDDDSDGGS